jgi:hypothetical protein
MGLGSMAEYFRSLGLNNGASLIKLAPGSRLAATKDGRANSRRDGA